MLDPPYCETLETAVFSTLVSYATGGFALSTILIFKT